MLKKYKKIWPHLNFSKNSLNKLTVKNNKKYIFIKKINLELDSFNNEKKYEYIKLMQRKIRFLYYILRGF